MLGGSDGVTFWVSNCIWAETISFDVLSGWPKVNGKLYPNYVSFLKEKSAQVDTIM